MSTAHNAQNFWQRSGTVLLPKTSGDTIQSGNGVASAPSYAFASDANTGMGWESADKFALYTQAHRQATFDDTFGVQFNPDSLSAFNFNVKTVNDTLGTLFVSAAADAITIGLGEGPLALAGAKLSLTVQDLHPEYMMMYAAKVPTSNYGSTIARDVLWQFLYSQSASVKVLSNDHFVQSISYTATGSHVVLTAPMAAHKITFALNALSGGTLSTGSLRFVQYSRDDGGGEVDFFDIHKTGILRSRLSGTVTIAAGAGTAPDSFVVTLYEAVRANPADIQVTGGYGIGTIKVKTYSVHLVPSIDWSVSTGTTFTGYVEYFVIDNATGLTVASGNNLAAVKTAAGGLLLIDADTTVVHWWLTDHY